MFQRPNPPQRYFTPDEANALLPRVQPLVSKASEAARRAHELEKRSNQEEALRETERLKQDLADAVRELQALGIEVKGLDAGLIDFPALRNGEPVYLCWRLGEPRVEWWHPLHTGFSGRQRLLAGDRSRWEWRN